jgi:hypothetical protein
MPKTKTIGNSYREKYSKLRNLADFNFKFDLRHQNDALFTKAQKAQITRAARELRELENQFGEMPSSRVKVRKLPNEKPNHYKKRVKQLQASEGKTSSLFNFVTVPTMQNEKVIIKGNKIIKKKRRKGSDREITEWRYKISNDEKFILLDNPHRLMQIKLDYHLMLYPDHNPKELLVGVTANGYPWKMAPVNRLSYLGGEIWRDIHKYQAIDGDDSESIVGHVIIRKLQFVRAKNV